LNLRFLQLTDIHFHQDNYDTLRMRDALIKYIAELKEIDRFDFLLITGDVANKGGVYNQEVIKFLDDIVETMEISKTDVHLIPGNHDIKRNEIRTLVIDSILNHHSPSDKLDALEDETYQNLINAQSNFFSFYKEFLGEEYPKDDLHFVKSSDNYNVLSLNTCLLSDKSGEEGKLLIGRKRFLKSVRKLQSLKEEKKINIAIGHHTIGCISPNEILTMHSNFDDNDIDLYISGHVHDPAHNITVNSSNIPFVEITSGAVFSDSFAVPGFVVVDINLDNGNAAAEYHIWNTTHDFWSVNNQVSKRTRQGKLEFTLDRIQKKKEAEIVLNDSPFDRENIDENEFKQFIIDFHESITFKEPTRSGLDNQIELDNKFYNMRCSSTFQKRFDRYSQYFGTIYGIMGSTSYVSSDKKELIADIIIDNYLELHYQYDNGDKIFSRIVEDIILENQDVLPYSKLVTRKYVKILTAWSIHECDIFNEDKRHVAQ
jgi:Calcineurin-like phosphoesterase